MRTPLGVIALVLCLAASPLAAQTHRRAHSVIELFNQKAVASDPAGIHSYSKDLIALILPAKVRDSSVEALAPLADRLAKAEQASRMGEGKLIPEADVIRAFNELMAEVGTPPILRTNESSFHKFREHAASIMAFPALLSPSRNGSNCTPGEAVFFIYLLISQDGFLQEQYLDLAETLPDWNGQASRRSYGNVGMEMAVPSASERLSSYAASHSRHATIQLFNHVAGTLGF